jgi:ATP-dependent Clp protease ATP-binding subunit ClpA
MQGLDDIARGLFRQRKGHVIVTGDHGVGKTTLVRRLAAETARGRVPFLSGRRFVRMDVANVGPEDSRACLEAIFTSVAQANNLVLCLDGIAALIPRPHGGTNKPLLRTLLSREGTKIIGIMIQYDLMSGARGRSECRCSRCRRTGGPARCGWCARRDVPTRR